MELLQIEEMESWMAPKLPAPATGGGGTGN